MIHFLITSTTEKFKNSIQSSSHHLHVNSSQFVCLIEFCLFTKRFPFLPQFVSANTFLRNPSSVNSEAEIWGKKGFDRSILNEKQTTEHGATQTFD